MSKYAAKQADGKFINIGYREDMGTVLYLNSMYAEYYDADKSDHVFYLKHQHYVAAMHEDVGKEFESARGYSLIDTTGTQFVLDWKNKKVSQMAVVSVPILQIIKRDLSEHLIPELWKPHRQIYIDHISIKVHPHDFCIWRFEGMGYDLTQIQSIVLDEVDYAIKRYISNMDKTMHFINWKVKAVQRNRKHDDEVNTLELIMPIVMEPLETILKENEVHQVMPRFIKAKKSMQKLISELLKLTIPVEKVKRFIPKDEVPF